METMLADEATGLHPVAMEAIIADVKGFPNVDVEPIVRCKNCKHADTIGALYCYFWNRNTDEDGYCHEGV